MLDNQYTQFIITRPKDQADDLLLALQYQLPEIEVAHLPLLNIELIENSLPSAPFDKAIFVSKSAANFYSQKHTIPQVKQYLAVGSATAKLLQQKLNVQVSIPKQMNAEGLLELEALQNINNETILLVKGKGGRSIINEVCTQRGAIVTAIDLYQRKLPSFAEQKLIQQANKATAVWIITSADAMEHLYRILGLSADFNHQTKVIVSSDRLAKLAKQKGFEIVAQSTGATDAQLVQCVQSYYDDSKLAS